MSWLSAKVDPEGNIMTVVMDGTFGAENLGELSAWAADVHRKLLEHVRKTDRKLDVLADLTNLDYTSAQAFGEMVKMLRENGAYVRKTATFGARPAVFAAEEIAETLSGRENFKAFHTEEDARRWLAET
jgi:NADH dehydrogenase FAD-containing subunit